MGEGGGVVVKYRNISETNYTKHNLIIHRKKDVSRTQKVTSSFLQIVKFVTIKKKSGQRAGSWVCVILGHFVTWQHPLQVMATHTAVCRSWPHLVQVMTTPTAGSSHLQRHRPRDPAKQLALLSQEARTIVGKLTINQLNGLSVKKWKNNSSRKPTINKLLFLSKKLG